MSIKTSYIKVSVIGNKSMEWNIKRYMTLAFSKSFQYLEYVIQWVEKNRDY